MVNPQLSSSQTETITRSRQWLLNARSMARLAAVSAISIPVWNDNNEAIQTAAIVTATAAMVLLLLILHIPRSNRQ